jgi:hypothetical protein
MAPDGIQLAVEGLGGSAGRDRSLTAFDGLTGKELWSRASNTTSQSPTLLTDPLGRILGLYSPEADSMILLDLPSGRQLGTLAGCPGALSSGARFWIHASDESPPGFELVSRHDGKPVVTLGINSLSTDCLKRFDAQGNYLAWGTADGQVIVAELGEIQRQLKKLE